MMLDFISKWGKYHQWVFIGDKTTMYDIPTIAHYITQDLYNQTTVAVGCLSPPIYHPSGQYTYKYPYLNLPIIMRRAAAKRCSRIKHLFMDVNNTGLVLTVYNQLYVAS